MDIIVKGHEFFYDITSVSMLFFPGEKTQYVEKSSSSTYILSVLKSADKKIVSYTKLKYNGVIYTSQKTISVSDDSKDVVKYTLFVVCSKATGIVPPWGTLTGIRPLSVYDKLKDNGFDAKHVLEHKYLLRDDKIELLREISDVQHQYISFNEKDASMYISIPFCPSKCTYCSFISVSAVNKEKLLDQYLELLKEEIRCKSDVIKKHGLFLKCLYIGGGTPGVLSCEQMSDLLNTLERCLNIGLIEEKCFELGRPDTVTEDKLDILKSFGFNRICINTQTTSDSILSQVNRKHTSAEYFNSVLMAKKYGFKSINTDIIAGLPGDTVDLFKKSVDDVISSGVDNITVHTLAIKKSAKLAESDEYYDPVKPEVDKMINYAYNRLKENGYIPYYIYRQKNCVSNGENIGFCKPNTPCLYNIYMMEDIHSIIACGAGASSKLIKGSTVQRVINVKYPMDYVSDFDKIHRNTGKIEELLELNYEIK